MSAHSFVCFCPKTYDRNPINLENVGLVLMGNSDFLMRKRLWAAS